MSLMIVQVLLTSEELSVTPVRVARAQTNARVRFLKLFAQPKRTYIPSRKYENQKTSVELAFKRT